MENQGFGTILLSITVAILIYDISIKSIVLVRQFRPAVYMTIQYYAEKSGNSSELPTIEDAIPYELCAGIVDRDEPPSSIAASEVLEETGYKIDANKLELISKYRSGVGASGALQHVYYVQVDSSMKVSEGGGCEHEDEMIDLFHLKLADVKSFIENPDITNRTAGLLLALQWFLIHKADKLS
uniref:Uridine diphosphate glucose pyrophosphatase NUDT14 n=1 Tax=Ciona savignyi TaxID=51511 RepID=H2ZE87_CIOSA